MTIALALAFALFVWWASTVAIIYLDNLPRATFKYSLAAMTVLTLGCLWGLRETADDTSVRGAYLAFTCGLVVWGWQEMSFYMGLVTGPRKAACVETCGGWRHFWHAIETSLWHELAIIAAAAIVVALTWGGANQIGTWTFLVLWWMHQSAKLNVFLGVSNLAVELLPDHLAFLKGFIARKPMNALFPFSVTISTVLTVVVAERAFAADASAFEQVGYAFLTAMMALAILEHWVLVVPMPWGALWNMALRSRGGVRPFDVEIVAGFLGAGKTSFLRRLQAAGDPARRTVVLVDAGPVDEEGDVVEMPDGRIRCSLKGDVATRLRGVLATMAPDRVLIEPSGVADVAALLGALEASPLKPHMRSVTVWTVIDAGSFVADYARLPDHFAAPARLAPAFVINKTDLVDADELATVVATLRTINPDAALLYARHGLVEGEVAPKPLVTVDAAYRDPLHERADDAIGLRSVGFPLDRTYRAGELRVWLDRLVTGEFGRIERLKGLARSDKGWLRFDIAGGRASIIAHAPRAEDDARLVAIGRDLDRAAMMAALTGPPLALAAA